MLTISLSLSLTDYSVAIQIKAARQMHIFVVGKGELGDFTVLTQAAQAQDERRRRVAKGDINAIRRGVLQGSRFIDFVWGIQFRYQNAKINS